MDWPWKGSAQLPVDDQCAWGSWMAPLMACICATEGPILEIGAGDWSTPFLHHYCACVNRKLRTLETSLEWIERYYGLATEVHHLVSGSYAGVIESMKAKGYMWSVALVDGSPSEARVHQCLALKDCCTYLVVHDYSGKECIETFTAEVEDQWPHKAVAPRPRYSPSSLILGQAEIPWFPGIERCG